MRIFWLDMMELMYMREEKKEGRLSSSGCSESMWREPPLTPLAFNGFKSDGQQGGDLND
jgi:hypothetical protein